VFGLVTGHPKLPRQRRSGGTDSARAQPKPVDNAHTDQRDEQADRFASNAGRQPRKPETDDDDNRHEEIEGANSVLARHRREDSTGTER
jgi:hypothetical protein